MHKRDNTGLERYRRWEERALAAGRQRLTVWVPSEAFSRLRVLAQTRGESLAQTVAALIMEEHPKAVSANGSAEYSSNGANAPNLEPETLRDNSSQGDDYANASRAWAGLSPEVKELVLGWRDEGLSWSVCAQRLDERGIKPPRGERWGLGRGRTNLSRFFRD